MEWISVKDRLPQPNEWDSIITNGKFVCWGHFYEPEKKWYRDACREVEDIKNKRITHWMPLPKPPEKEK